MLAGGHSMAAATAPRQGSSTTSISRRHTRSIFITGASLDLPAWARSSLLAAIVLPRGGSGGGVARMAGRGGRAAAGWWLCQPVDDGAIGAVVAAAAVHQVFQRGLHRLHLAQLGVQL